MAYDAGQAMFLRQHGLSNKEIAARLGVSPQWVSKHLPRIRRKDTWTMDEEDRLSALLNRGATIDRVAAELDRSVMSCKVKASRMRAATEADATLKLVCRLARLCRDRYGMTDIDTILAAIRKADIVGRLTEEWRDYGWQ